MRFSKLAYLFVLIVSIFVCWYIGSGGEFNVKFTGRALPSLFEYMWARVTEGVYDFPPDAAAWEGLLIGDKTYVYYGFFPAIVRAFYLALLGNSWYGNLNFLSCLTACFIITSFSFFIVLESLRFWNFKNEFFKTISVSIIAIAIVIGGPVIGCILRPNLYEELILWGYAFSTVGIYGFIRFLDDTGSKLGLVLLSISASCALVSRATFGGALYLLVGITFVILIYRGRRDVTKIGCLCPALIGLTFQLWYNYVRFGNALVFLPTNVKDQYFQYVGQHGGVVNPYRIRDLFLFYFVPLKPSEFINFTFPYFRSVFYTLPNEQYFMDYTCQVTPIFAMVPYSLLFYLGGIVVFIRELFKKNYNFVKKMIVFSAPFVCETLLILSYNACFERFKPEFMPLILVLMFFCFRKLKSNDFLILILILCILSIPFNLEWAYGYGPG